MRKQVYAVDLDGVLAYLGEGPYDEFHIGPPVPKMVARVRQWLQAGIEVWIFTARAAVPSPHVIRHIQDWTKQHIGVELPVTATKFPDFIKFYDDRAVQVVKNSGDIVG